jgi:hypothetical protein
MPLHSPYRIEPVIEIEASQLPRYCKFSGLGYTRKRADGVDRAGQGIAPI